MAYGLLVESTQAGRRVLIGLVAAVVLVAVVIAVVAFKPDKERDEAKDYFETYAGYYCIDQTPGQYSDEFKRCVDETIDSELSKWEDAGRPDPAELS